MRSREAIIDAVLQEIGESGFDAVSISGIAARAGVARQTIYTIFGSRELLIAEAVQDRLRYLHVFFRDIVQHADSPLDVFVDLMIESRRVVHGDPMLQALATSGGSNPMFDSGAGARAREFTDALLAPMPERFPETADHFDDISDLCVHVGWSVLSIDDSAERSDDDLRRFLNTWLGPAFAELGR